MQRQEVLKRLAAGDARARAILASLDDLRDAETLSQYLFVEGQEGERVLRDGAAASGATSSQAMAAVYASSSDSATHERQVAGSRRRLLANGTQFSLDYTAASVQIISNDYGNLNVTLDTSDDFPRNAEPLEDLDGNGVRDLAIGCRLDASKHGAIYILFLATDFTAKSVQKISSTGNNLPYTLDASDLFGVSTGSLGEDLDGDGVHELAVGAAGDDSNRGAVYILFLATDGKVKAVLSALRPEPSRASCSHH